MSDDPHHPRGHTCAHLVLNPATGTSEVLGDLLLAHPWFPVAGKQQDLSIMLSHICDYTAAPDGKSRLCDYLRS